jgi:hypothetical protein
MKVFFYILFITIITLKIYFNKKSNFWKYEPVFLKNNISQNLQKNQQIIKTNLSFQEKNYELLIHKNSIPINIQNIYKNQYYKKNSFNIKNLPSDFYLFSIYSQNSPIKKKNIGHIIFSPHDIYINNILYKSYYVDYLLIEEKYRNQNMLKILIKKVVNYLYEKEKILVYFFKIDIKQLPFNNFYKENVYSFDKTDFERIKILYNFKEIEIKKNQIEDFLKNEYNKNFIIKSFLDFNILNNKIQNNKIIILNHLNFFIITIPKIYFNTKDTKHKKYLEIVYLSSNITPEIFYNFLKIIFNEYTDIFINLKENIFEEFGLKYEYTSHYYLYNYKLDKVNEKLLIV